MIFTVVGARPNFMKIAPLIQELQRRDLPQLFVHTGQHYDAAMSTVFFEELGMPQPDVFLGVGSGSHAAQTARIMTAFEEVCLNAAPRLVVVAGDVNSTLACALVAAKLQISVAHIEAGLRSGDRSMPEEINRVLTDHMSDLLFTTEPSGTENLLREGIEPASIHFVGNTMIDSLFAHLPAALARSPWRSYGFEPGGYGVVTFHRPSNVDHADVVQELVRGLADIAKQIPLLFPIHPRTRSRSPELWTAIPGVRVVEPLGYLEFLGLIARSALVLTDSGGIQEETTVLGIPCLTVRKNTERPITISIGTNRLVAPRHRDIIAAAADPPSNGGRAPELWDGRAAGRIADVIQDWLTRDGLDQPAGT